MATTPIRNLLEAYTSFPASLYYRPNRANYFNAVHTLMHANMGLGETIAAADPEQREWLFLLSAARRLEGLCDSFDDYLDPIARVPLLCMPAMLWLHKEDPASYQWILENLDARNHWGRAQGAKTILFAMHYETVDSTWGVWFQWRHTPQGFAHWQTLSLNYSASAEAPDSP